MRGRSGVLVHTTKGANSCPFTVSLISDVNLVQASYFYSWCLLDSERAGAHRDACVIAGGLHPPDAVRLGDTLQVILRLWNSLCRSIPRVAPGWMSSIERRDDAVLTLLRVAVSASSYGKDVSVEPLSVTSNGPLSRQSPIASSDHTDMMRIILQVKRVLAGRLMTFPELMSGLEAIGQVGDLESTMVAIDALSIAGLLEMRPGVRRGLIGRSTCERCGSSSFRHTAVCHRCGARCSTCLCCSSLGAVTSCTWLFHVPIDRERRQIQLGDASTRRVTFNIPFSLTGAQRAASRRVREFVARGDSEEFLVWAVCGSGKTEVVCSAIADVLSRGGTVLYAVPRQSVAIDIHARLTRFFRGIKVGLHSGSKRVDSFASRFLICTAHQTLRLRRFADLVVFDEVDAYPCVPGGILERSVKSSLLAGGKLVYLTATPDEAMFRRIRRGQLRFCLISSRHHGMPVPVPEIVIAPFGESTQGLKVRRQGSSRPGVRCLLDSSSSLQAFSNGPWPEDRSEIGCILREKDVSNRTPFRAHELCLLCVAAVDQSRTIVFVPTIRLVEEGRRLLSEVSRACWPHVRWGFCHSKLANSEEVINGLKTGRITSLMSTTVLERGITVSGVNVIVMRADSPVFDCRSLVQMAGRAGRTSDCPTGRVWFSVRRRTREVTLAVKMIEFMNQRLDR